MENNIHVGDWIKGIGFVPYGKVTKVTNDTITYKESNMDEQTITFNDIEKQGIIVHEYSQIRNQHLNGTIPEDYYLLTAAPEKAKEPNYKNISYYAQLIGDLLVDADIRVEGELIDLTTVPNFLNRIKEALTKYEDEEDFYDSTLEWIKTHIKK